MAVYKLGAVEARFAELIWENEPLPSNRLAKLAELELGWKKSTTYTILKRLCERAGAHRIARHEQQRFERALNRAW